MSTLRLKLGADVVATILPHRPPFLLVDRIGSLERGPQGTLQAAKLVSANEPVFAGHLPGLRMWPGVYTIEGLGQSCMALQVLCEVFDRCEALGVDEETAVRALRALDPRARPARGISTDTVTALRQGLAESRTHLGVTGHVDVRLTEPVFAGDVLEYQVRGTHTRDPARRFDVEALVEGRSVARGSFTSVLIESPPSLR